MEKNVSEAFKGKLSAFKKDARKEFDKTIQRERNFDATARQEGAKPTEAMVSREVETHNPGMAISGGRFAMSPSNIFANITSASELLRK